MVTIPYSFTNGNIIDGPEHNSNNTALKDAIDNTSTGHDHDGVNSRLLPGYLVANAQQAYQQVEATTFTNRDFLAADIWADVDGKNNTRTGGTASYDSSTDSYKLPLLSLTGEAVVNTSFVSTDNAFDSNDATSATRSSSWSTDEFIGKTWTDSKSVASIRVIASGSAITGTYNRDIYIYLDTYNGSSWTQVAQLAFDGGYSYSASYNNTYTLNQSVKGIRIRFVCDSYASNSGLNASVSTIDINFTSPEYSSSGNINTNTGLLLDGTEKVAAIYCNSSLPSNTSMTVNISDGSNTISSQPLNTPVNISSLSSGTLTLSFNLNTSVNTSTPVFYGYGAVIGK